MKKNISRRDWIFTAELLGELSLLAANGQIRSPQEYLYIFPLELQIFVINSYNLLYISCYATVKLWYIHVGYKVYYAA